MRIKLLSESTINRIAAGEVIERPASVIKELVENSIDANSTKIDIFLEQAGKNLIVVADNGDGMAPEDLELAVLRHSTSKLDEEDLLNIHTFGFRGEALPSIGAISKMTITSKEKNTNKAFQIEIIGGKVKPIIPTIHNEGTKIEIRDLFFATPARLKFLRTDKTELNACVEIVKKLALAHPEISFSLYHDNKTIIKVQGQKEEKIVSLKKRLSEIIGNDFIENSTLIDSGIPTLSVLGFCSLPTFKRATAEDQFLFINNRPVKDKILNIALKIAYQDYLAKDSHPVVALFLQIDPTLVDVNVHPAKSEVRFHDPTYVRNFIISAIKNSMANINHKVSTSIASTALGFFNLNKPNFNNAKDILKSPSPVRVQEKITPLKNIPDKFVAEEGRNFKLQPSSASCSPTQKQTSLIEEIPPLANIEVEELQVTGNFPLGAAKAQLHRTYIISQTDDSIIIIDQHAAHERIGYEKIKRAIKEKGLIKQRLLIPEIVELPDIKRAELLFDKKDDLSIFGLTIEKFGEKSIIVSEIPTLVGDINVFQLIQDLADHLSESGESINLTELIEHVTETYACHYSIRAGRSLSVTEMNELLRQMEQTPFSGQCNHGRPTYIELKLKDIEKLFSRR